MTEKANMTLPATVEKIILPSGPGEPEKAHLSIQEGAAQLYKEIRIANSLTDANGNEVKLKDGAHVEVRVEAKASDI